jgi:carboxypeptidase D
VGGHPNSTVAIEDEKEKVKEAEFRAYYRSGEAALVFVILAAAAFGLWVWRGRRKARGLGYVSLPLVNGSLRKGRGDVEAGDYGDNELDDLESSRRHTDMNAQHYDLASDSEDDNESASQGNNKAKQSGPR